MAEPQLPQQPKPTLGVGMKQTFNLVMFFVITGSNCVAPIIRYGMGTRGIGAEGLFSFLLMTLWAGHSDSPEMLQYIQVWFVFVVYRRIRPDRRQLSGYGGSPLLTDWLIRHDILAKAVEPVAVYVIGYFLCEWSASVGQFVMATSFALLARFFTELAVYHQQKEAAHNAIVQMQMMQQTMNEVKNTHR